MSLLTYKRLRGERVFVVGAGGSLNDMDLDKLKDENVILCNRTIELREKFNNYTWVWNDMRYLPDIAEYEDIPYDKAVIGVETEMRPYWQEHIDEHQEVFDRFKNKVPFNTGSTVDHDGEFSYSMEHGTYAAWSIVPDLGIPLAMWWGCDPIYLIGCDTSRTKHFNSSLIFSSRPQIKLVHRAYKVIRNYADTFGFRIYNAGIGGELDAFKRVDYEGLFE